MNMKTLCTLYRSPKRLSRTTRFRAENTLQKPLSQFQTEFFPLTTSHASMASHLAKYAPLTEEDFENPKDQETFGQLQKFPQDRAFFEMLLQQDALFKKHQNLSVKEFLDSQEGRTWLNRAKRLKRKPIFCLEIPYYPTRKRSLRAEADLKQLLRKQPLLRYLDLKDMGFKNVQSIMERFPSLNFHRRRYLKRLASSLAQAR